MSVKSTALIQVVRCNTCGSEVEIVAEGFVPIGTDGTYHLFRLNNPREPYCPCTAPTAAKMVPVGEPTERELEY